MKSLLENSALIEESRENYYTIQVWPKSNPLIFTVEVTNRFKELDLIDRVPEELWMEVCGILEEVEQDHPLEKERQKGKMVVWESLTNSYEKKRSESKGEKER